MEVSGNGKLLLNQKRNCLNSDGVKVTEYFEFQKGEHFIGFGGYK